MTQLGTSASPSIVAMIILPVCVLAIGFMVRFFVALTVEDRQLHSVHVLHPSGVHCEADTNCVAAFSRRSTVNSAAYVALGVVRITSALASNASRRKSDNSIRRPQVVTVDGPSPEVGFPAEHRYRSG
jgi:hypothetical protein